MMAAISITGRWSGITLDKEVTAALIGAVIGSIVSFVLLVAWDVYRRWRERRRGVWIVREEVDLNLGTLSSLRRLLLKEKEVIKERKALVEPLPELHVDAWQATWLSGGFSRRARARELARTYTSIVRLNQKLQARQLYTITNGAMSSFYENLSLIDDGLLDLIDRVIEPLTKHRESLWGWRMVIAKRLGKWFGKKEATTT